MLGRNEEEITFRGHLLAEATSHEATHQHQGEHAPPHWKCRACRWFEVGLYRVDDPDQDERNVYMVHTRGMTNVPNEITYGRAAWAESPYQILVLLTQWKKDKTAMLPEVSLEALWTASDHDPALRDALNRWLDAGA